MPHSTDTAEAIRDRASDLADKAKSQVASATKEQAEATRDAAVEQADNVADAARDAQQNFDPNSLQAEALRQVSSKIEEFTRHLRNKPVGELADDAAVFARRNPLLVLGGAAIVGFAAARFLKSGTENTEVASDDPWSGHLAAPVAAEHPAGGSS